MTRPFPFAKTQMKSPDQQRAARLVAASVCALCIGLASATPAKAQFFGIFRAFQTPSTLSPEMVYRQLVRAGYQPIGQIQRNGRVYVASVYDPRRRQLRLVIDSAEGRILERYVVAARQVEEPAVSSPALPPRTIPSQPPEPKTPAKPKITRQEPERAAPVRNPVAAPVIAPTPAHAPAAESTATVRPPAAQTPVAAAPAAPVAAAPTTAPARPAPPRAEAPAHAEGPGYANGVPINPLD